MNCNQHLSQIMITFRICRKLSDKMFLDFESHITKNFIFVEIDRLSSKCTVYIMCEYN